MLRKTTKTCYVLSAGLEDDFVAKRYDSQKTTKTNQTNQPNDFVLCCLFYAAQTLKYVFKEWDSTHKKNCKVILLNIIYSLKLLRGCAAEILFSHSHNFLE